MKNKILGLLTVILVGFSQSPFAAQAQTTRQRYVEAMEDLILSIGELHGKNMCTVMAKEDVQDLEEAAYRALQLTKQQLSAIENPDDAVYLRNLLDEIIASENSTSREQDLFSIGSFDHIQDNCPNSFTLLTSDR